ncbi:Coenzyme F420-reducing hydrogenase, beta subunit [Lachnospiraceae bacterium]|nr:Coenzyme F420-reducing hydrogenase, beta subunit [Lachnospiraceae bacterium]
MNEIESYPVCYAGYSDSDERMLSSSGGIFSVAAKHVIKTGGVVCGAAIDEKGNVFHKCVENIDELRDLYGSKYAQSNVGRSYAEVKKYLKEGRKVLFCGTPCQANALAGIVGDDRKNLIIMDFICHGVPNPEVFRRYIEEQSGGKAVKSIYFRNKDKGWNDFTFKIVYRDSSEYARVFNDDEYMHGFLSNLYLRPSCYKCGIKGQNRKSDLTIGDFWGVQEEEPEIYDEKGVSVLLVNNEQADRFLLEIKDELFLRTVDINKVIKHNSCLVRPVDPNVMTGVFYRDYTRKGVKWAVNAIWRPSITYKVRNKIIRGLKKVLCR